MIREEIDMRDMKDLTDMRRFTLNERIMVIKTISVGQYFKQLKWGDEEYEVCVKISPYSYTYMEWMGGIYLPLGTRMWQHN